MSATAFFFSVCLNATGECHDEKLADFDSPIAMEMCDANKFSFTEETNKHDLPKDRKRSFNCGVLETAPGAQVTAQLVYRVCEKGDVCAPEVKTLGNFYGEGGMKICDANKKYWLGPIQQSAKMTGTEASLSCDPVQTQKAVAVN